MLTLAVAMMCLVETSETRPVDVARLAIRQVTIGSARSSVIAQLGEPERTKSGRDEEMGTGDWQELYYPGLMVEVIKPPPGHLTNPPKEPYVARIVITHQRWATPSGVQVGSSMRAVIQAFGRPDQREGDRGGERLWYATSGFDGRVVFRCRQGRVVEITVEEDWT